MQVTYLFSLHILDHYILWETIRQSLKKILCQLLLELGDLLNFNLYEEITSYVNHHEYLSLLKEFHIDTNMKKCEKIDKQSICKTNNNIKHLITMMKNTGQLLHLL